MRTTAPEERARVARSGPAPEDVGRALEREVRGEVLTDAHSRHLYSSDASMYAIQPLAVVRPADADDVATAVAVAGDLGVSVIPRGAGTSLAGQTIGAGIVLDLSRHMRRILELDPESRTARVQPGVVQDDLNRAAARHGLMFGADTSTSNRATLGGMIGNNSSGTHSIVYGTTVDHVEALSVVLADGSQTRFAPADADEVSALSRRPGLEGEIYRRLPAIVADRADAIRRAEPHPWRHSGGYRLERLVRAAPGLDLAKFAVGTEGTLAVVTEAEVGLVERPPSQAMAVGHFRSTREAIAATHEALALGAAAIELMDETILRLSRSKREFAALSEILDGDPKALLFVTFFGETEAHVAEQVDLLATRWKAEGHGYHTLRAVSPGDRAALLKVRKSSLGLLMAASRGTRRPLAFVEDTAVDPARLEAYVDRFQEVLDRRGMEAGFYGHCSVGCLHIRPFVDLTVPAEVEAMRAVAEEIAELVIEFGGVNSSEHGDGLARSTFNARLFGPELYGAMQSVKRVFDPSGVLNPGKIVDGPPMTENLRDAMLPPAPLLQTRLRFAEPEGMRAAADRCMNIGACRKTDAGTMCPSYMVTRQEEHATRGRANALVLALSQPDPRAALGDERLHEVLDLCIECKACKAECPLSVDMASLKSEFLSHYQDVHGVPVRSRLFGRIRALNRLGSMTAPLANAAGRARVARRLLERQVGIAAARPLPQFERRTLMRWFEKHDRSAGAPRGEVVFLADSFTSFTETRVARAAIELLQLAGWQVHLESRGCCGRSSLSKGLLDQAAAMARATVDRLAPYADRGVPIVGVEPSCILTLRDEYRDLIPDHPGVDAVARQSRAVADLLLEAIDDGGLPVPPGSAVAGRRIVLHPHCHEKAVTGTAATARLLRSIPGAEVVELDVGCCGMAGSFGFEADHYEISVEIAGMRLVPALEAEPTAQVAATGVSCRQQIAHVAGRDARHPLEILREACGG